MKRTPLKRKTPLRNKGSRRTSKSQRKNAVYTASLRQKVYERDGGLCQKCGRAGEQIHHVIPRGRYYSPYYTLESVHDERNLMLVCHDCHHGRIHSQPGYLELAIEIQEQRFGKLRKEQA